MSFERDIAIAGGCGHVGFPRGLAFACRGLTTALYDIHEEAVATVVRGQMPSTEPGAVETLARVIGRNLHVTTDPAVLTSAAAVAVVVGTPLDEHLDPDPQAVPPAIEDLAECLVDGQLLVLRSTLYREVTALLEQPLRPLGWAIDIRFCPERTAEGQCRIPPRKSPSAGSAPRVRGHSARRSTSSCARRSLCHGAKVDFPLG